MRISFDPLGKRFGFTWAHRRPRILECSAGVRRTILGHLELLGESDLA
jgi:hypothetical protein